jgi:hypothetical protein
MSWKIAATFFSNEKLSDSSSPENHSILPLATEFNIETSAQLKIVLRSKMLN